MSHLLKMIKNLKFGTRTPGWFIIVFDLCISFVALIFAYLIRFDLNADINILKFIKGLLGIHQIKI